MSVKELLRLHGELMFVKNGTDKESLEQYRKVHEKSKIVDQKLFKKYQEYQAGFQERLDTLRALPRKNPKTAGHDKNMPPILKQFKGAAGSVQDAKNFWDKLSCRFDDKRVGHYETANKDFLSHLELKAANAADKVVTLLVMDNAFLKSGGRRTQRTRTQRT